jgi:hypothetical protein
MRKLMTILGITLFTSALALPVFARGPGMGRGFGMMGSRGPSSAYCDQDGRDYQERSQRGRGQLYQEPDAQFAPNDRFGRGYRGDPNPYEKAPKRYSAYGHMGGFGMGGR